MTDDELGAKDVKMEGAMGTIKITNDGSGYVVLEVVNDFTQTTICRATLLPGQVRILTAAAEEAAKFAEDEEVADSAPTSLGNVNLGDELGGGV